MQERGESPNEAYSLEKEEEERSIKEVDGVVRLREDSGLPWNKRREGLKEKRGKGEEKLSKNPRIQQLTTEELG